MNITGYKIRNQLQRLQFRLKAECQKFTDNQFAFTGEIKESPEIVSDKVRAIEDTIARLQELQARYNLKVLVPVVPGVGEAGQGEA